MVEHIVVLTLGLFVIYCGGRFVRPIGDFYAAVLQAVATICQTVDERVGHVGGSAEGSQSSRLGVAVIPQLAGLAVGLLVLVGEFISSYLAVRTLFGDEVTLPRLPIDGLTGPALAVLIFSLCVIYGICWVDAAGWAPVEIRILMVPESKRKPFQRFAGSGLLASVLAMTAFYAERALYLGNSSGDLTISAITSWLQVGTFVLLGLLVAGAGLLAVWLVIVGLQALIHLALALVAFAAALLEDVCEVVGRHFSRPRDSAEEGVLPVGSAKGESLMRDDEGKVGIYFLGQLGSRIQPGIERDVRVLHAEKLIASSGSVNFNRQAAAVTIGQDVTPPWEEQKSLRSGAKSKESGQGREHGRKAIAHRLGELLSDANHSRLSLGATLWFFIDADVLPVVREMLELVHRNNDDCAIAVVTQLHRTDRESAEIRAALDDLRTLWETGVVTATFVLSAPSAFTNTVKHSGGEGKQLEFICRTVIGLLLADEHNRLNPSCKEVLEYLGRISPFLGCSFASDRLSPQRLGGLHRMMQWMRGERTPVVGDSDDIRLQLAHVTRQVLADPDFRASQYEMIHGDTSAAVVLCSVPLTPNDARFEPLREWLTTVVARDDEAAVGILASGNGVPLHLASSPLDQYYVAASCIYPLAANLVESVEAEHVIPPSNGRQASRKAR